MASNTIRVDAMVVGGGIAGMQSALDLADQGYQVALVEKEASIGGKMIALSKVFPTLDCCSCITTPKMSAVAHHDNIQLFTYCEVQTLDQNENGYKAQILKKPRYVNESTCTGCRQCEYACPIHLPNAFDLGYVVKALYPLLLLPLLYTTGALCMVIYERSDKRMIKNLFGRYVSSQVANEILDMSDSGRLQLGGELRTVSVLFADIRGFTQMSERMSPEEVVDMLNSYLSIIVDKVLEHEGMVNKFAGDCIMAVWNAPQRQNDHAELAVRAAYESQQLILQKQKSDDSSRVVQFGIGINTGEAVAGNLGSTGRAEYTVIGDSVNLASRICSATPGGEIWIGQQTYQMVKDTFKAEEMEPQSFKGKSERVVVYRII